MKRESKARIDYGYHKEEAQRIVGTHEISYYLLLKPLFIGYCGLRAQSSPPLSDILLRS